MEMRCWRLSSAPSTSSSEARTTPATERGTLARWLPVLVWAGCIGWFSGDAFSARSTHNYIDPVIRFLFGDLSPEGFRFAHAVVRKTAHFVEYAFLAFLLVRALAAKRGPVALAVVGQAILYSALYASADELHQYFVPSRGGSPMDVALDTLGATTGAFLMFWRRGRSR
jgi:VanZ like family